MTYLESVSMLAVGVSSPVASTLPKPRSHNSNWVSLVKLASTAPARVPVATKGS